MAMRPRGGGGGGASSRRTTRSGVARPVYDDFTPEFEWEQDDESHILSIYLPGFMKEQVKATLEGRNTIRVRGERLVGGNRWSRFQENFQVPENGEMNSARAKFHGGILSISVPREKVGKEDATGSGGVDGTRKQPTPQKGRVESTPEVSDMKGGIEQQDLSGHPETKRGLDGNQKQPILEKSQDKASPADGTSQSAEENSLEPLKASAEPSNKASVDPKNPPDKEGDRRGRSFTPMRSTGNVTSKIDVNKESNVTKEKHVASEKPDEEAREKEGKETTKMKKLEKDGAANADDKESYRASKKQKHKKETKGLTELNEERQLLVNMGTAMLVIVALTAYVTYSFVSAKDKK
ncbi:hypothetical protein SASPL_151602 [Salvia splendens]|uniref:SHSP domain-containing protein n=1 Tax=Salvia splendens TaxID=180675 RepID=A0A8X8W828_SALSN|nr:inactive protein RESTRICTED TEV MOVEMENT 2-like [Salvia splendens]KAG6390120.1 hypothetical protein SASPL_151602 [Salvia splendens]